MPPPPSPPRRLLPLGCALAAAAVMLFTGCGDDSATSAVGGGRTRTATASKPSSPRPVAATPACPAAVEAFVESMVALRRQLAVGLSYEQYAARVGALHRGYDRIPTGRLALACLRSTGTPAESAFNQYVEAANAWGECLADAACTTAAIEPVLQRRWRLASGLIPPAG